MLQLLAQDQETFASANTYQNAETRIDLERDKHVARTNPPQPLSPATDALQSIPRPLRDVVSKAASQARQLSQAMVQQALELGQMFWQMQRDLKTKEYKAFLGILGWASAKARKYINLAKTFDGFERSQLIKVELTTLLSLCTSRYSSVVSQLREVQEITQQLVEQLIKETRSPRSPKQDPISGWKQNRSGGGRRYEVILHDEKTGLSIEQQALAEQILPQRVIAEAIALRAEHKSSPVQADEHTSEESQTVTTPNADSDPCVGDLSEVVAETQELETPIPQFQVGDSVKIVSDRRGPEFDGQIGVVKTVSFVGCVLEANGKTVWFGIDELDLVSVEETYLIAEPEAESRRLAADDNACFKLNPLESEWEEVSHLVEEHADFIDDVDREAHSLELNSLEVW